MLQKHCDKILRLYNSVLETWFQVECFAKTFYKYISYSVPRVLRTVRRPCLMFQKVVHFDDLRQMRITLGYLLLIFSDLPQLSTRNASFFLFCSILLKTFYHTCEFKFLNTACKYILTNFHCMVRMASYPRRRTSHTSP